MNRNKIGFSVRALIFGVSGIAPTVTSAAGCDATTIMVDASPLEVAGYFARQNKLVVTFVGYSAAGYQDEPAMLARAAAVLDGFDPVSTVVNIGATPDGIGAVYELAKRRGFGTTGIVSTQAKQYASAVADCVDRVFYVEDAAWGGFLADGKTLTPTSVAMVESSDVMVGIGGGEVARDELLAARRLGKPVHFYAADMDHAAARDKAREKNLPEPTDFRGAAHVLDRHGD